jgi:hypothetical protein
VVAIISQLTMNEGVVSCMRYAAPSFLAGGTIGVPAHHRPTQNMGSPTVVDVDVDVNVAVAVRLVKPHQVPSLWSK